MNGKGEEETGVIAIGRKGKTMGGKAGEIPAVRLSYPVDNAPSCYNSQAMRVLSRTRVTKL